MRSQEKMSRVQNIVYGIRMEKDYLELGEIGWSEIVQLKIFDDRKVFNRGEWLILAVTYVLWFWNYVPLQKEDEKNNCMNYVKYKSWIKLHVELWEEAVAQWLSTQRIWEVCRVIQV